MEDSSEDSDSEAEFDEESIIKYYFNHGHTYSGAQKSESTPLFSSF